MTPGPVSEWPGPGESWTCATCGRSVLGYGAWAIAPEAVCQCCAHDRRPIKPLPHAPSSLSQYGGLLGNPPAPLSSPAVSEWQPIETAPEREPVFVVMAGYVAIMEKQRGGRWLYANGHTYTYPRSDELPSCWRPTSDLPLPPPPTPQTKE
jgi:hypothetical protein